MIKETGLLKKSGLTKQIEFTEKLKIKGSSQGLYLPSAVNTRGFDSFGLRGLLNPILLNFTKFVFIKNNWVYFFLSSIYGQNVLF